ncbi:relaxase/mobilization nuclease domain-containing protein [Altererythrobacter sp. B11]|uniref:relaxase/mobilization nuclease domain-containing protein n=1 Tax=Altererythrobacter sp. B11 TaxID=2060312 RepID=UPI0011AE825F|nr:relaxase/mobilization nuclease domain-containing protein [Altererythrobacter sp. B11]
MTVFYKAESNEASRQTDIARLRGKAPALIHYVWRADLSALARASMDTHINSYHRDLLRYVERDGHREEVAATLARHVLSDTPDLMSAELASLMEEAGVGDGAIEHLIVSVREGDDIIGNFEEAVDILVEALGLGNCPVIGAVHSDTDHGHFHLVILRVDVETGELVNLPSFDIIRGHQALAVMEDRFGWQREADARWKVEGGRLILDGKTDVGPADDPRQWPDGYFHHPELSRQGRKAERHTGYVSAERRIRDVIPGILERTETQDAFVTALAEEGIELTRAHRGAAYLVKTRSEQGEIRTESVKASVVRGWGWKALERKYGPFPEGSEAKVSPRTAKPIGDDLNIPRYRLAKSQYQARLNVMMRNVRSALQGGRVERAALAAARASCVFPTFDEWAAGARPPEIGDVLFATVGARLLEAPKSISTNIRKLSADDEFAYVRAKGRETYWRRGVAQAARVVDFGESIVLVGRLGDEEIRKAMTLLSIRGANVVAASGLTAGELRLSKKIAAELNMSVVRRGQFLVIPSRAIGWPSLPAAIPDIEADHKAGAPSDSARQKAQDQSPVPGNGPWPPNIDFGR